MPRHHCFALKNDENGYRMLQLHSLYPEIRGFVGNFNALKAKRTHGYAKSDSDYLQSKEKCCNVSVFRNNIR